MPKRLLALLLTLALAVAAQPLRADDHSASPATIAGLTAASQALLATAPAMAGRSGWFVQNQSAARVFVVLDDGRSAVSDTSDASRSVFILDAGAGANAQGGSMGSQDTGLFWGRIRIYGPAGAQVALMTN